MSQVTEPSTAPEQANAQDVFLNQARRDRLPVLVHLINGRSLVARIKSFDRFALVLVVDGLDQLVFKHAIATIETDPGGSNYVSSHDS